MQILLYEAERIFELRKSDAGVEYKYGTNIKTGEGSKKAGKEKAKAKNEENKAYQFKD